MNPGRSPAAPPPTRFVYVRREGAGGCWIQDLRDPDLVSVGLLDQHRYIRVLFIPAGERRLLAILSQKRDIFSK